MRTLLGLVVVAALSGMVLTGCKNQTVSTDQQTTMAPSAAAGDTGTAVKMGHCPKCGAAGPVGTKCPYCDVYITDYPQVEANQPTNANPCK